MQPMKAPVTANDLDASAAVRTRVGYLVYRVERRLRARIDHAVRAHGVTTTEYVTLSVLRRHDGMSGAELARWAFVSPQAMNLVVSALEKRSLVHRQPDSRRKQVLRTSVTPQGIEVLKRCERSMDEIEADMLGELTTQDVEGLRRVLALCARSLEATAPREPLPL